MTRESQCQRILKYLRSGHSLTKLQILSKFGAIHGGGRILDLREDGWPIKTTMIKTPAGKRVARYSISH